MSSELAGRLDNWSDRLSPMVVKEVRQMVRGREFTYSFGVALIAGLIVAFVGLATASETTAGAGQPIYTALMLCLVMLGLVVVPLGAFNALRTERADHTFDLITQTSLTPRRIVLGKLLTQGVKLVTLFAGLSPFVAMSFLLGGVDFLSILVALAALFLWSMWVSAVCLFVSASATSRAVTGIFFAVFLVAFLILAGRFAYLWAPLLGVGPAFYPPAALNAKWAIAGTTGFCLISMANFVLLAENRLSHPVEDRSTALRVGFFVQFLYIIALIVLPFVTHAVGYTTSDACTALGIFGGLQLAIVAIFATTEDMALSRRVIRNIKPSLSRPWFAVFRPGGGRATMWVLLQMAVFLVIGGGLVPLLSSDFLWLLGICSYICFFTGVPAFIGRYFLKARLKTPHLRVFTFVFVPLVILSGDVLQYFLKSKIDFLSEYSAYHILNPFRTLSSWSTVTSLNWDIRVYVMGIIGLASYAFLIRIGQQETENASVLHTSN